MEPVVRGPSDRAADFYLLTPEDNGVVQELNLEYVATGKVSGAVVAAAKH